MGQIKVAVEQVFDKVDAIIFEAALTLNELKPNINRKNMSIDAVLKNVRLLKARYG